MVITTFNEENVNANQPLLDLTNKYASEKKCTSAQTWILKGHDFIVPIPGIRKEEKFLENLGAANVELTDKEYVFLDEELDKIKIYGDRNGKDIVKSATVPGSTN